MKELLLEDYQNLRTLYLGGSFSEMKVLYHKLRAIKEEIKVSPIKLSWEDKESICDNEKVFFSWIKELFPSVLEYLKKDNVPNTFDENEFTKFKNTRIKPEEISNIKIKRIKKLEIWGNQQKIKQNYQKVEEICFDDGVITFYLSNDTFLKIWNPVFLYDSDYSLQIKNATKIVLALAGKEIIEYILSDNQLKITSNKDEGNRQLISCKSVFIKALEIIK